METLCPFCGEHTLEAEPKHICGSYRAFALWFHMHFMHCMA